MPSFFPSQRFRHTENNRRLTRANDLDQNRFFERTRPTLARSGTRGGRGLRTDVATLLALGNLVVTLALPAAGNSGDYSARFLGREYEYAEGPGHHRGAPRLPDRHRHRRQHELVSGAVPGRAVARASPALCAGGDRFRGDARRHPAPACSSACTTTTPTRARSSRRATPAWITSRSRSPTGPRLRPGSIGSTSSTSATPASAVGRTGRTPPWCSATPITTSSNSPPRCQPTSDRLGELVAHPGGIVGRGPRGGSAGTTVATFRSR